MFGFVPLIGLPAFSMARDLLIRLGLIRFFSDPITMNIDALMVSLVVLSVVLAYLIIGTANRLYTVEAGGLPRSVGLRGLVTLSLMAALLCIEPFLFCGVFYLYRIFGWDPRSLFDPSLIFVFIAIFPALALYKSVLLAWASYKAVNMVSKRPAVWGFRAMVSGRLNEIFGVGLFILLCTAALVILPTLLYIEGSRLAPNPWVVDLSAALTNQVFLILVTLPLSALGLLASIAAVFYTLVFVRVGGVV